MNFSYESNSDSSCPSLAKLSSLVPRRAMTASNEGALGGVAHDDTVVGYVLVDEGVRTNDYVVADGHAGSNRCAVPNLNHPRAVYINRAVLRGVDKGVVVACQSQRVQIFDIIPAHVLGVINQLFDSQLQVHHYVLFLMASVDQD